MTKMMKIMFLVNIAVITVIALNSMSTNMQPQTKTTPNESTLSRPNKRVSRFLVETSNQNRRSNSKAANHCNKDNEVCNIVFVYGKNSTCCNNKCMDVNEDDKNCGACHNKCKFTQHCCGGECVDLSYDKRHCGKCNNNCFEGQFCDYGMCDYA
ncbi:hypothetical protein RND81_12G195600 [Saponaria officinalis]|uniref:Uncharacterized protein n=1 Tax=Saponaria officinalis TaxID=3572 RepID=A0AAW1HCT8_SAPOF